MITTTIKMTKINNNLSVLFRIKILSWDNNENRRRIIISQIALLGIEIAKKTA